MRKRSLVLFVAVVVAVVPVYGFSGEPNYSTNGLNGGKDEVRIAAGVSHGNGQGAPGTTLQKPRKIRLFIDMSDNWIYSGSYLENIITTDYHCIRARSIHVY